MEAPLGRLLSEHSPVGWRCHDGPADREAALLLDDQSDDVVLARCALGAAQPTATMTVKPTTRRQHAVSAPDHLLQLLRVACAVDFSAAHSYLPAARDAQWPSAALRSVGFQAFRSDRIFMAWTRTSRTGDLASVSSEGSSSLPQRSSNHAR